MSPLKIFRQHIFLFTFAFSLAAILLIGGLIWAFWPKSSSKLMSSVQSWCPARPDYFSSQLTFPATEPDYTSLFTFNKPSTKATFYHYHRDQNISFSDDTKKSSGLAEDAIAAGNSLHAYFAKWLLKDCHLYLLQQEVTQLSGGNKVSSFSVTSPSQIKEINLFWVTASSTSNSALQDEKTLNDNKQLTKTVASSDGHNYLKFEIKLNNSSQDFYLIGKLDLQFLRIQDSNNNHILPSLTSSLLLSDIFTVKNWSEFKIQDQPLSVTDDVATKTVSQGTTEDPETTDTYTLELSSAS